MTLIMKDARNKHLSCQKSDSYKSGAYLGKAALIFYKSGAYLGKAALIFYKSGAYLGRFLQISG